MKSRVFLCLGTLWATIFLLIPVLLSATVITVRQDGSGDYTAIADAVAAASTNDTIDVGPGTYNETIDVTITLALISSGGAGSTIIDGLNAASHFQFTSAAGSEVVGLTFVNGYHSSGGGSIRVKNGATLTIRDCLLQNNNSDYHGGAIFTSDAGSSADVYDCIFIQNSAVHNGGAVSSIQGSQTSFTNCTFLQNSTDLLGGALIAHDASMDVRDCLFHENVSADVGGGIYFYRSNGIIQGNTFHANTSPGAHSGTILIQQGGITNVVQNIISSDNAGYGLYYYEGSGTHSCNVFWDNARGPINGSSLDPSEVIGNPLFCDPSSSDFTIANNSPATPDNNPCGQLIGAFPAACDIDEPSVEPIIISVLDIPDDQGGQVRIKWNRCYFDTLESYFPITGYGVYRYQGAFGLGFDAQHSLPRKGIRMVDASLNGWDYIASIPARGDSVYQFIAPTLCDSTASQGICWSIFFVSAMTADPMRFFDSAPDSGYSVDNLPPHMPTDLIGMGITSGESAGLRLSWNASGDHDVSHYVIYKDTAEDFIPDETSYLGSTTKNSFHDGSWAYQDLFFYKVAAVDIHDNISLYSVLGPTDIVIGTLLQSYSASYNGTGIEISWTLTSQVHASAHHISRAEGPGGQFEEINEPIIVQNDMTYAFIDRTVEPAKGYRYHVEVEEPAGQRQFLFETENISTPLLPVTLYQNHPNPFNPTTTIDYYLPERMHVRVEIYDVSGRQVACLVNEIRDKGFNQAKWNGKDDRGNMVASGAYFYRLVSGKEILSRKMIYLK